MGKLQQHAAASKRIDAGIGKGKITTKPKSAESTIKTENPEKAPSRREEQERLRELAVEIEPLSRVNSVGNY